MKEIDILGVPIDLGAGRRGVNMGPSALRLAGLISSLAELHHRVRDRGDLLVSSPESQPIEEPRLRYLSEIVRTVSQLAQAVEDIRNEGHFPLVLGGDHSIAMGTLTGLAAYARRHQKKQALIWLDAHADMNTPDTSPSGNIHGMPLAAILGYGAPELVNLGGFAPKVLPQHTALIGVRSIDPGEREIVKASGVRIFTMEEIDRRGICPVLEDAIAQVCPDRDTELHLSFDVDSLDPTVAPGVGTPVRGGLTYREVLTAMEMLSDNANLASMEVVEVNPILDVRNQTSEITVDLICSALGRRLLAV